jgi:ABC-type amino acid transport substrate-binding protein
MPNLKVVYNPVTSANRIPLVANGTVQIECGSTVNNAERQQQVSFSDTTFIVSTRFIAKKASNVKTLEDLRGKTVVCTAGTNTLARDCRPAGMSDDEALVYDFTYELDTQRMVSDATFEGARTRFGENGVVDLLGLNGYYTFLAMLMNGAQTGAPPSAAPPLPPLGERRGGAPVSGA